MKETREAFEQFLRRNISGHYGGAPMIFVSPPWQIEPCECGDLNCRGWRVVTAGGTCPTCGHPRRTSLDVVGTSGGKATIETARP